MRHIDAAGRFDLREPEPSSNPAGVTRRILQGRPPEDSIYAMRVMPGEAVRGEEGDRHTLTGAPTAIRDDLATFAEAGLTTLVIGYESPDKDTCIRRLEEFAELAWGQVRRRRYPRLARGT